MQDTTRCKDAGPHHDKKMMERPSSLPPMSLSDPGVTLKNNSLLEDAKKGPGDLDHFSHERRFPWQKEKAVSFDLDSKKEHDSDRFQG